LRLREESVRRQKLVNVLTGTCAILCLTLAVILFKANRSKEKMNEQLSLRVKERTKELSEAFITLKTSQAIQSERFLKVSSDIKALMATVCGLQVISKYIRENDEDRYRFAAGLGFITEQLNNISGYFRQNKG
jgi:hypothetical protein